MSGSPAAAGALPGGPRLGDGGGDGSCSEPTSSSSYSGGAVAGSAGATGHTCCVHARTTRPLCRTPCSRTYALRAALSAAPGSGAFATVACTPPPSFFSHALPCLVVSPASQACAPGWLEWRRRALGAALHRVAQRGGLRLQLWISALQHPPVRLPGALGRVVALPLDEVEPAAWLKPRVDEVADVVSARAVGAAPLRPLITSAGLRGLDARALVSRARACALRARAGILRARALSLHVAWPLTAARRAGGLGTTSLDRACRLRGRPRRRPRGWGSGGLGRLLTTALGGQARGRKGLWDVRL